jgi:nicotinamidase-related amidase
MSRPILLVIDLLNDYFQDGPLLHERRSLVQSVNNLTRTFRSFGLPVAWVRQEFADDLGDAPLEMQRKGIRVTIAGTDGARLLPDLERAHEDLELVKKRYSAFFQTDLDLLLSRRQGNPVVLAGINTHACIRATAIDAYQRDLDVMIARECVRSYDQQHHRVTLSYLDGKVARVLSNAEIATFLSRPSSPDHAA